MLVCFANFPLSSSEFRINPDFYAPCCVSLPSVSLNLSRSRHPNVFSISAVPIKHLFMRFLSVVFDAFGVNRERRGAEGIFSVNRCSRLRAVLLALCRLLVVGEDFSKIYRSSFIKINPTFPRFLGGFQNGTTLI